MATRPDRPNLLFIFTDEQRADTMAAYGNDHIRTPNLNLLSKQSFVFENAYASQPVSTSSRSTILTGTYPHTNGCTSNNLTLHRDAKTIAEMVSNDYRRGYYGKWHLGDELRPQHGFEEWRTIEDAYRSYYSDKSDLDRHSDYHQYLIEQGYEPDSAGDELDPAEQGDSQADTAGSRMVFSSQFAANLPSEHTKAAFVGRQTEQFIHESTSDSRPFMLYANFLEPHPPFTSPNDKAHRTNRINERGAFLNPPAKNTSMINRLHANHFTHSKEQGEDLSKDISWRRLRSKYFGLVTTMDGALGGILKALEDSGQAHNTIIVFTSEHGEMMGDHRMLYGSSMYQEAIRVPLLIRIPWLEEDNRTIPGNISHIDLVPTLLELLGERVQGHLQGESRASVMLGDTDLSENDVVVQWNGEDGRHQHCAIDFQNNFSKKTYDLIKGLPWRTIMTPDGWKLSINRVDQCELYDLNNDPYETTNLYHHVVQRDRVRDLVSRIRLWQERHKDYIQVLPEDWGL